MVLKNVFNMSLKIMESNKTDASVLFTGREGWVDARQC